MYLVTVPVVVNALQTFFQEAESCLVSYRHVKIDPNNKY